MALRSFDSQTRLGIPRPSKSFVTEHRGEVLADEGTLILEPAPISVAPQSFAPPSFATIIPPPPPSSMRPMTYSVPPPSSVRPSMPSWDDRSGWTPAPNEITKSTRIPPKRELSMRERSASAMLMIATAAMLAALASIGFMHKASRHAEAQAPAAAAEPLPQAAPVAPPVAPIDIDDVNPPPVAAQPVVNAYPPAPAVTLPATPAPAEVRSTSRPPSAPVAKTVTVKEPKEKAPSQTAQQKALEDLLEQLGEEQLKR